ncbi:MAG: ATP-binding cassette domain-containing protein [Phycisphaera sp.]|nr:ATP-binding cassette domain-containing protein [Phycisphaera sp.]
MPDSPTHPAPLRISELTVRYGQTTAVADVSLDIPAGAITAIVGPSGCGKSSLLAALNRMTDLIPTAVVTGHVRVGDTDVYDVRTDVVALRRRVGMIFQRPNPFAMSVRRNVTLALREHGVSDRAILDAITERALRDVGLWDEVRDRLDRPATTLSGGQQQRLCIARAIALEPDVLLMDEPCSALDPIAAETVERHIASLRGRYTVVLVTHNLAQARRLADHTAVMWLHDGAGRIIEHGPTAAVFDTPTHDLTARYVRGLQG